MSERISELPSATVLNGTDLIPVVQDGTTKRATIDLITAPNLSYSFIVTGTELGLPTSRVLTAGNGINILDNGAGSTVTVQLQPNPHLTGTAALGLPSGNTSQRPSGDFGYIRANSDYNTLEWYSASGWASLSSGAAVTSVGLSLPAEFSVSGSPVTSSGTLSGAWASAMQNYVFAAPNGSSGTPSFRALVAGDIPSLSYAPLSLTSAQFFVGNGSNVATGVAMSGDASLANTGAVTLATVNSNVGSFGSGSQVATFTVNGKGLITSAANTSIAIAWSAITSGTPTTLSGYGITDAQPLDGELTAIAALATTGIAVRTAANTWAIRDLSYPAAGLVITNSAGVAGNPTFALANDLAALEGLSSTGIAVRTATDAWAQRSVAAGTGVDVTNGDGVSGNPTVAVNPVYIELAPRWYS